MITIQYAIIGGTGVYDSGVASIQKTVNTEYGKVEVDIAEVEKQKEQSSSSSTANDGPIDINSLLKAKFAKARPR